MKSTLFNCFCLYFLLIINCESAKSQAPNWIWASKASGNLPCNSYAIVTDSSGNSFITGSFSSTTFTFGTIVLTNSGITQFDDIFIAKYSSTGNVIWAKSAGGIYSDRGNCIAMDPIGNLYIAGYFSGPTITFGTTTLTNVSSGTNDIFIAKYSPLGNVLWATSAGGNSDDSGVGITIDNMGNCFLTGSFYSSSITIGSSTLVNSTVSNPVTTDLFIAKYSQNGNLLWASSMGGNQNDEGTSICADKNGNVYMAGHFASSLIAFGSTTLTNYGSLASWDAFLTKYSSSGIVQWAKKISGNNNEFCYGISLDSNGNPYLAGHFDSPSITLGTFTLTNVGMVGYYDNYATKYSPTGNAVWAIRSGGPGNDHIRGIVNDTTGNSYITGYYYDAAYTVLGTTTLTNIGTDDIIVAKISPIGNILWATSAGGSGEDMSFGVSTDGLRNIYITGLTYNTCIFGSNTLTNVPNDLNVFIAKLGGVINNISDNKFESKINIFPNPTKDYLNIKLDKQTSLGSLKILNVIGETLCDLTNLCDSLIDTRQLNLANGIYILQINSSRGSSNKKFIIQK